MTLTDAQLIRIGRTIAAVAVLLAVGGLVIAISLGRWQSAVNTVTPINASVAVGFGALAWTVLPKQPRNRSVWAYTVAAFFGGLYSAALVPLVFAIPTELEAGANVPADLEWPSAIALTILAAGWIPSFLLPLTLGLLLFPDGQVPSPRWRWALRFQATTLALAFVLACAANNPRSTRPIPTPGGTLGDLAEIFILLALLSALLGIASLVVRYRKGDAVIRHQIRWIAAGGALVVIGELALRLAAGGDSGDVGPTIQILINLVPLLLLIAAFWVAITRYRLYEIDTIISKSVTYFGLAVAIVGLYAAIVVIPLLVIGASDDGGPGLILPIVASALVAVLFEPVRSRLQRAANRLVYGDRVSPYEVLSQVTSSLPDVAAGDGTADLAQLLARGTGADRAIVWVAAGGMLRASGVFPDTGEFVEPVAIDGLADDDVTESRPVLHHGVPFGALTITKPRNDPMTPDDRQLLSDVAAASGLLLRNISLNSELEQRAMDVRESRRRLIAARDAERHRLERDLHDGAQQQVVALKVKLGIARTIAQRENADEIVTRVTALADETQHAVDALRAVAHGIYPPLLDSEGLEAALRAVERMSPIDLTLTADGLGRYGREAEETVYFCVLETVERARMSGAAAASATVATSGAGLVVCLDIDGCTTALDLTSVADRIDAAGGTFTVEERSGGATRITSILPVTETVLEPA